MIQVAMTPEQFAAKREQLKREQGIDLIGRQGSISKSGVSATYVYNGEALKVLITHKPFLVSTAFCEQKLLEWLNSKGENER